MAELILASLSPRRRELLGRIDVVFRVRGVDVDESVRSGELPPEYTRRVAREKALAAMNEESSGLPVLAADTAVVAGGRIFGKPEDREEAVAMLRSLSGREHEVYSAVSLALTKGDVRQCLSISRVTFAVIPVPWIRAYCDTDEPMDKAGAYGVQGRVAQWISRLEGSCSGVMGLPLFETAELLRSAGILPHGTG